MAVFSQRSNERCLAEYYDAECHDRACRGVQGMRLEKRNETIEHLLTGDGRLVLDIGMGPARDAADLVAAGLSVVGFDLSLESCRYGAQAGVPSVNGSTVSLPFAGNGFVAAWSMSVLMHLDDSAIEDALIEINRVVRSGGHVALGTWGGRDQVVYQDNDYASPRPFHLRSDKTWQSMVDRHIGPLVEFGVGHHDVVAGWWYQWCVASVR